MHTLATQLTVHSTISEARVTKATPPTVDVRFSVQVEAVQRALSTQLASPLNGGHVKVSASSGSLAALHS